MEEKKQIQEKDPFDLTEGSVLDALLTIIFMPIIYNIGFFIVSAAILALKTAFSN